MYSTEAYASKSLGSPFEKITIQRNECGPDDVEFDILYCGICHTDLHITMNHTGSTKYPIVPGHELAGIVTKVGGNVTGYGVGDRVGVGCISESCLKCVACLEGDEQQCEGGMTGTYNGVIKYDLIKTNTGYTFGGYSQRTTVNQRFIIRIPDKYPLECAGPIFCAGITMFSPLKYFGAGKGGKRVGIIGIGGLCQMGVRLAVALGNEVTAISTNPAKKEKCAELGAKHFVISTDPESMKAGANSLDLILNTISAPHDCTAYLPLLARNSTLVQIGLVTEAHSLMQGSLMMKRLSIAETQECIDLCAAKDIKPEIEIITAERITDVHHILDGKNDSVKRYVLDLAKSSNL
jgi:uncharacterized zinc-type alcohol dehydrogenase-like protein